MDASKIHLSPAEAELMNNAGIILTKNSVLQKIKLLLEEVQAEQQLLVSQNGWNKENIFTIPPKISRGENYMGLPYLILDYPRINSPSGIFFIRTMFWWGNFFSSTLHISGLQKEYLNRPIQNSFNLLSEHFIGLNTDPWVHHFEESNYKKIGLMGKDEFEASCNANDHMKIAIKWPLIQWEQAPFLLFTNWKFLLKCCDQLPRR